MTLWSLTYTLPPTLSNTCTSKCVWEKKERASEPDGEFKECRDGVGVCEIRVVCSLLWLKARSIFLTTDVSTIKTLFSIFVHSIHKDSPACVSTRQTCSQTHLAHRILMNFNKPTIHCTLKWDVPDMNELQAVNWQASARICICFNNI